MLVAAIVLLSLMPPLQLQAMGAPSWNDKVGHALAYFTLMFWNVQLAETTSSMGRRLGLALLLGASMEVAQSFTATRSADGLDMVANASGALAASALWWTPARHWLARWDH